MYVHIVANSINAIQGADWGGWKVGEPMQQISEGIHGRLSLPSAAEQTPPPLPPEIKMFGECQHRAYTKCSDPGYRHHLTSVT